jgi:hypothetical protein
MSYLFDYVLAKGMLFVMQSEHYTKPHLAVTLMSSSLSPDLHMLTVIRAKAELSTVSDHIRNVMQRWIDADSPLCEVSMDKFRVGVAAYFSDEQYHRVRDVAKRRRISVAHAIRIALTWYHYKG